MSVKTVTYDNKKYNAFQLTTCTFDKCVAFLKKHNYSIKELTDLYIVFFDTDGIAEVVPRDYWISVAKEDNTEYYILPNKDFRKMFEC